jgi:hypothetical protein
MTTMIEESFSKRCNVSDPDPASYYGYEDLGYGDGAPDVAQYGYGDGAPSPSTGTASGSSSSSPGGVDYGYGDAAPDLGYGDGAPDTAASHAPKTTEEVDYGYGDASPESGDTDASGEPQRRPRRRNSVTRYSIVDADSVKTEFQQHANVIDAMRNGGAPPSGPGGEFEVPIKDGNNGMGSRSNHSQSDDGMSYASSDDDTDGKEKKKRGGLGGRWRIGRNASNRSKN